MDYMNARSVMSKDGHLGQLGHPSLSTTWTSSLDADVSDADRTECPRSARFPATLQEWSSR